MTMIGKTIGSFQVVAKLGEGGMGEVYRARDPKLNRDVAIKIIPAIFATDPERLARFRREAQVLAALNHPNIAHIYGVEDAGDAPALVLEFVDGPTLAARIAAGPMDVTDALSVARQIALALEAAHAQGIVHRDLKPANVKLRDDGTVKVLDFGLAKALEGHAGAAGDSANSPTITNLGTSLNAILGTAAYMAPEQAKGKPVDRRADIWAFGVVLYEMLTGRRLFRGEDVTDTLVEVLKSDPDWDALPRSVPPAIRRLLRRCLERDLNKRLHDVADARLDLEEALASPAAGAEQVVAGSHITPRERLLWLAAVVGTGAVAVALSLRPRDAPPPETRLHIAATYATGAPVWGFALSPDGRSLAYWGTAGARNRIWVRPLGSDKPFDLPGTDVVGTSQLVWAPDGRSIFYIDGTLREVTIEGSRTNPLPARVSGFGFTRNAEGTILVPLANASPVHRLATQGGTPEPATRVVPPQIGHRNPHFLPDGRRFLLLVTGPAGVQGIYHGSLGSLDVHRLVDGDTAPVFLPPDVVVFGRQDSLFAQRVNIDTLAPVGEPVLVADSVHQNRSVFGSVAVSAAGGGTLAYRPAVFPQRRLTWRDRAGRLLGHVGDIDTAEGGGVRLSPDERTIALVRRVNGNSDIWTIPNAPGGARQRVTFDPALDSQPVWSADGSELLYQSSRRGGGFYDLYRRSAGGEESVLLDALDNKTMNDWSTDDRFALFTLQRREQVARDLWILPLPNGQPFAVAQTPADETGGRLSPDSRWVAYQSTAAGAGIDIYVRPVPGPGREHRISAGGGTQPQWRRDGRELYYEDRAGNLIAVPMRLPARGDALEFGAPATLFRLTTGSSFAPSRDGQRFLVNEVLEDVPVPPVTIVLNWRPR
jgi:Tol biopolymer transport system component